MFQTKKWDLENESVPQQSNQWFSAGEGSNVPPPGDAAQYLETFCLSQVGVGAPSNMWVRAGGEAELPHCAGQPPAPHDRIIWAEMSIGRG